METEILIYEKENIKKSGGFKKNFNPKWISKEDFFKCLEDNDLNISSDYMDIAGSLSNGKRFRCSYGNLPIGTSAIVKEFDSRNN